MKRILSLLLVVLMLVSVLAACGGDDTTTTTPTPPNPPAPPLSGETLAKKLYDEGFFLVGPAEPAAGVNTAIASITTIFQEMDSFFFPVDEYESPADKEIIVQVSRKRPSNETIKNALVANRVNSSNDYQIKISENTVNIVGSTDQALVLALQRFATMLREDSSLYFPAYDSGIVRYQWPATQLGGQPIQNYKIVIPTGADAAYQTAATNVQNAVFAASGYTLPIIDDSQSEGATELVVGKTARAVSASALEKLKQGRKNFAYDAILHASGTQFAITGGAMDAVNIAVSKLGAYLDDTKQTEFATISKLFQKEGLKALSFGTTEASEFRIVIAKDAAYDLRYLAWQMQQLLYNKFGYDIEIVTDDVAAVSGQKEIILGKTSRTSSTALLSDKYATKVDAFGNYVVDAGNYVGVQKVYAAMLADLDAQSGNHLTVGVDYSGTVTDVKTTWKAINNTNNTTILWDYNINTQYDLVWNDEFDGSSLNYEKWVGGNAMVFSDISMSMEAPYVVVKDGQLVMTCLKEDTQSATDTFTTSYAIATFDTMNFSGGYLEMRAKIPMKHCGEWPSFWSTSSQSVLYKQAYRQKHNGQLYDAGYYIEVDFFEAFNSSPSIYANLHKWFLSGYTNGQGGDELRNSTVGSPKDSGGNSLNGNSAFSRGNVKYAVPNANDWHTFGFLWTDELMAFDVDGQFYFAVSMDNTNHPWKQTAYNTATGQNKVIDMGGYQKENVALSIILNNMFYSPVANNGNPNGYNDNLFPMVYTVEYMRLYQCSEDFIYTPTTYGRTRASKVFQSSEWRYAQEGTGTPNPLA